MTGLVSNIFHLAQNHVTTSVKCFNHKFNSNSLFSPKHKHKSSQDFAGCYHFFELANFQDSLNDALSETLILR